MTKMVGTRSRIAAWTTRTVLSGIEADLVEWRLNCDWCPRLEPQGGVFARYAPTLQKNDAWFALYAVAFPPQIQNVFQTRGKAFREITGRSYHAIRASCPAHMCAFYLHEAEKYGSLRQSLTFHLRGHVFSTKTLQGDTAEALPGI